MVNDGYNNLHNPTNHVLYIRGIEKDCISNDKYVH